MKFSIIPANFDRDGFYNGSAERRLELAKWILNYTMQFTPGTHDYLECQAAMQAARAATKVKAEAQRELAFESKYYNELAAQYD